MPQPTEIPVSRGDAISTSDSGRLDSQSVSSANDPPSRFLSPVEPPEDGIDTLTESTLKVFSVMRPWYLSLRSWVSICMNEEFAHFPFNSFEHPILAELVESLVRQVNAYCSALANSLNTANNILRTVDNDIQLCDDIAEGRAPARRVPNHLQSMLDSATKTYQVALKTKEPFCNLHSELLEVSHSNLCSSCALRMTLADFKKDTRYRSSDPERKHKNGS
jgi:hypothetical protein